MRNQNENLNYFYFNHTTLFLVNTVSVSQDYYICIYTVQYFIAEKESNLFIRDKKIAVRTDVDVAH